jgi:hypothetical protein
MSIPHLLATHDPGRKVFVVALHSRWLIIRSFLVTESASNLRSSP